MGLFVQAIFLLLVALTSVSVCCGLLLLLFRMLPLIQRQRAALWGVRR